MSIANPVSDSSNSSIDNNSKWRLEWWGFIPIPIPLSWIKEHTGEMVKTVEMEMEGNAPPGPPPSYREGESLDDTWSRYNRQRRYDDNNQPPPPQSQPKIQVPISVIITVVFWSIAQLVGGVWWAATLQSDLRHEIADRQKEESRLWQSIETYRLENNQLRVEVARNNTQLRNLKEEN